MKTTSVTMRFPNDDLAAIDAEVGASAANRTQFMLELARAEIIRRHRERDDQEIGRILADEAEENLAIVREFDFAMADGLN